MEQVKVKEVKVKDKKKVKEINTNSFIANQYKDKLRSNNRSTSELPTEFSFFDKNTLTKNPFVKFNLKDDSEVTIVPKKKPNKERLMTPEPYIKTRAQRNKWTNITDQREQEKTDLKVKGKDTRSKLTNDNQYKSKLRSNNNFAEEVSTTDQLKAQLELNKKQQKELEHQMKLENALKDIMKNKSKGFNFQTPKIQPKIQPNSSQKSLRNLRWRKPEECSVLIERNFHKEPGVNNCYCPRCNLKWKRITKLGCMDRRCKCDNCGLRI